KQYKDYFLLWKGMDKEKYWTVFLRQEPRFRGLLWKREYSFNSQTTKIMKSVSVNNVFVKPHLTREIFSEYSNNIYGFNRANIIQVSIENEFDDREDSRINLSVSDSLTHYVYYDYSVPLIHYSEKGLNKLQKGEFNYEFNPF